MKGTIIACEGAVLGRVELPAFVLRAGDFLRISGLADDEEEIAAVTDCMTGRVPHPAVRLGAPVVDGSWYPTNPNSTVARLYRGVRPLSAYRYLRSRFGMNRRTTDALFAELSDTHAVRSSSGPISSHALPLQHRIIFEAAWQCGQGIIWNSGGFLDELARERFRRRIEDRIGDRAVIEITSEAAAQNPGRRVAVRLSRDVCPPARP
jgi:hypothetical protein